MSELSRKQAQRLAQSWCDADLHDARVGEWGVSLSATYAGKRQAIVDRVLEAFPWLSPSQYEVSWDAVYFDGEVASSAGPLKLKAIASVLFSTDEESPWIGFSFYPNVFVTGVERDEGHGDVYDEASAQENREKLTRSLKRLEKLIGGKIEDSLSDQFEAIDNYGIPADAKTVYT